MKVNQFLRGLFAASFIFIFIFFPLSVRISGIFAGLSAAFLFILLVRFVYTSRVVKRSGIRLEEVTFAHTFLFRTFFRPKDLWVKYDDRERKFRPADFRDMPLEVGMFFILGLFLLYTTYLMLTTLFYFPALDVIRIPILVIIAVIGIYSFFVSIGRIMALLNSGNKEVAKLLNKNRTLGAFIRREKAYAEVTPSFTLEGFVTSFELVTKRKYDTKKFENLILDVSRTLNKYK
jgi:hypothetical protein